MLRKLIVLTTSFLLAAQVCQAGAGVNTPTTSPSSNNTVKVDDSGFFLGTHIAYTRMIYEGDIIDGPFSLFNKPTWGVDLGYKFTHRFGLELDYSSYFKPIEDNEVDPNTGQIISANKIFTYRITPSTVWYWNLNNSLDLIGKLGISYFRFKTSNPDEGITPSVFTGYIGLGLAYNITRHVAVDFTVDDSTLILVNVISANLGVQYRF